MSVLVRIFFLMSFLIGGGQIERLNNAPAALKMQDLRACFAYTPDPKFGSLKPQFSVLAEGYLIGIT
jgi:hypothetical protein